MITKYQVFCSFPIAVECRCPGPQHVAECDAEENKPFAADEALTGSVSVNYDDFVERED